MCGCDAQIDEGIKTNKPSATLHPVHLSVSALPRRRQVTKVFITSNGGERGTGSKARGCLCLEKDKAKGELLHLAQAALYGQQQQIFTKHLLHADTMQSDLCTQLHQIFRQTMRLVVIALLFLKMRWFQRLTNLAKVTELGRDRARIGNPSRLIPSHVLNHALGCMRHGCLSCKMVCNCSSGAMVGLFLLSLQRLHTVSRSLHCIWKSPHNV